MEPRIEPRLRVGMKVAVAETDEDSLKKLHAYNNVEPPKRILQLIGHVGLIVSMSDHVVTVRFFTNTKDGIVRCWGNTSPPHFVDVVWIDRALNPCPIIHFLPGDIGALVDIENLAQAHLVTISANDESRMLIASLENCEPHLVDPVQEPVLPVYAGDSFDKVMRHPTALSIGWDKLPPMRLIHRPIQLMSGNELIQAVRDFSLTGEQHNFKLIAQKYAQQVNHRYMDRTPLQLAAEMGNWAACVALIAMGGNRNIVDLQGNNLLHLAAHGGSATTLEGLLFFIADELNRQNADGDTPLHFAAQSCHAACVDRLLSAEGIAPNKKNILGNTALHVVARLPENEGKQAIINRMLNCVRVSTDVFNKDELTPLQIVISKGYQVSTTDFLTARPRLLLTGSNSNDDGPQQYGPMVSAMHLSRLSPLHTAALFGRHSPMDVIIGMGADMNAVARTGATALHLCVENSDECVEDMVERLACVQLLVTSGSSINAQNNDGNTPLHLVIMRLNSSPQPPNDKIRALRGSTSCMKLDELAAKARPYWDLAVAAYLCLAGADTSIANNNGETASSMCRHNNVRELLSDLISFRIRPCLPPSTLSLRPFDSSGVKICTFDCNENPADVIFQSHLTPCNHNVVCRECILSIKVRRCPICLVAIESFLCDGKTLELPIVPKKPVVVAVEPSRRPSHSGIAEEEVIRLAVEAAERARKEAEEARAKELQDLRMRLDQIESAWQCAICMDKRREVVFRCGHTACQDCCASLVICHICREPITGRQFIYA